MRIFGEMFTITFGKLLFRITRPHLRTPADVFKHVVERSNIAVRIENVPDERKRNRLWRFFQLGTWLRMTRIKLRPGERAECQTFGQLLDATDVENAIKHGNAAVFTPCDPDKQNDKPETKP